MVSWTLFLSGLALLRATAVQAVFLPAGLPDGLYTLSFDANGTAVGEPVLVRALDSAAPAASRFFLDRRQRQNNPPPLPRSQSRCGTGGAIDLVQFPNAKAQLQAECDHGDMYPPRTAVVFTAGRSIAYFCNFDASNRCWRQEVEEAFLKIVTDCGSGRGGEIYVPSYSKSYGGDNAGQQVCRF